jgi:hypothetical protein
MLISWSNRSARRRAASNESGRFVSPMTITGLFSVFSQDMSVRVRLEDVVEKSDVKIPSMQVRNHASFHLPLGALSFWSDSNLVDGQ